MYIMCSKSDTSDISSDKFLCGNGFHAKISVGVGSVDSRNDNGYINNIEKEKPTSTMYSKNKQ